MPPAKIQKVVDKEVDENDEAVDVFLAIAQNGRNDGIGDKVVTALDNATEAIKTKFNTLKQSAEDEAANIAVKTYQGLAHASEFIEDSVHHVKEKVLETFSGTKHERESDITKEDSFNTSDESSETKKLKTIDSSADIAQSKDSFSVDAKEEHIPITVISGHGYEPSQEKVETQRKLSEQVQIANEMSKLLPPDTISAEDRERQEISVLEQLLIHPDTGPVTSTTLFHQEKDADYVIVLHTEDEE